MPTDINSLLPFLIPIGVLELVLTAASLIHVLTHKKYRFGNRALWVVLSIFPSIIGPIIYFIFGRGEEE